MSHLTPEDQVLLELARDGDAATRDDHARVKRKLMVHLGVGLGVGTSAGSATGAGVGTGLAAGGAVASTGAKAALLGKVIVAVALVGTLGGGAAAVNHWRAPAGTVVASRAASTLPPAQSPAPPASFPTSTVSAPPPATVAVATHPTARARHDLEPSPIVREWKDVEGPTPPPAPAPTVLPPPPSTATSISPAPANPPGPATLDAEADLLRRADAARKRGDAAGAIALLDQLRARYPNGVLLEEREAERIVVLCAAGPGDEGRAAAARFLRDHPRSPMAGRVRASCGGG